LACPFPFPFSFSLSLSLILSLKLVKPMLESEGDRIIERRRGSEGTSKICIENGR
jgi:hypothetical protein